MYAIEGFAEMHDDVESNSELCSSTRDDELDDAVKTTTGVVSGGDVGRDLRSSLNEPFALQARFS